jgi:hypothetical protein
LGEWHGACHAYDSDCARRCQGMLRTSQSMKPPRPIARLDKSKSKSRAKMALNFLFNKITVTYCPRYV